MTEHFARRLAKTSDKLSIQIDTACRLAFGRHATELERSTLIDVAQKHGLESACRVILNANAFIFID